VICCIETPVRAAFDTRERPEFGADSLRSNNQYGAALRRQARTLPAALSRPDLLLSAQPVRLVPLGRDEALRLRELARTGWRTGGR
jgi:hypothetical protein